MIVPQIVFFISLIILLVLILWWIDRREYQNLDYKPKHEPVSDDELDEFLTGLSETAEWGRIGKFKSMTD